MRRRTTFLSGSLAAIAAIACLTVSACTPGVAGGSAAANTTPSGAVTTDPAKLGNVTLNVLDYFTGGVDNTWMNDVVAAFEKKYPNITVKRQSITWSDLMQELPLKLKSPNPPDIVPPNQGWQSLGTLVQGGLVDNLDSYATAYGWDKNVPGVHPARAGVLGQRPADGHRHPVRHAGRAVVDDRGLLQPLAAEAASG